MFTQTLEQKNTNRCNYYRKLILSFEILLHEERIHKNTYDKLYSLLKGFDDNIPYEEDFKNKIISEFIEKTYAVASPQTTSHVKDVIKQGAFVFKGQKYCVTFQKID